MCETSVDIHHFDVDTENVLFVFSAGLFCSLYQGALGDLVVTDSQSLRTLIPQPMLTFTNISSTFGGHLSL